MSSLETRLRAENETLRERLRQVELVLVPRIITPSDWKLTPQEARLFAALTAKDWVPYARLYHAIRFGMEEGNSSLVHVVLTAVRRKTRPFGVEIETMNGQGLRLIDRERWARVLS